MKKILLHPLTPIVLAPLILLSPLLLGGKALFWGTPSTQFIPWWDFAWESLLHGQLPLWNPLAGMGAPLAANYQSALFYPPYWIYFGVYAAAGTAWMAWAAALVVCAHLIWSGVGVAVLLKDLDVGRLGQTVGGLAFSLSGYLVARAGFLSINAAAAWLPWLLLTLRQLAYRRQNAFLWAAGVIAMQLLAGHAQTAWYSLVLGGIWIVFWSYQNGAGSWLKAILLAELRYLAAGLLAGGITAVQLVPTLEYLLISPRSAEYGYSEAMTYSFWPWRFLTVFVPDLFGSPAQGNYWGYGNFWEDAVYIGLLPVLLALGLIFRSLWSLVFRKRNSPGTPQQSLALFLGGITLVGFLLALGSNTAVFPFLYRNIPSFDLFQAPTRWTIWSVLSLSLLAGLGVDTLSKPKTKRLYMLRLAAAGCLAVVGGSVLAWLLVGGIRSTILIATGKTGMIGFLAVMLLLFFQDRERAQEHRIWSWLVVGLVGADLLLAGWGLNPGVEKDFYALDRTARPDLTSRVWMPPDLEYELKFHKYFLFNTFVQEVDWTEMQDDLLPNLNMLREIEMVNNFDPMLPERYQRWIDAIPEGILSDGLLRLMDAGYVVERIEEGIQLTEVELPPANRVRVVGCGGIWEDEERVLAAVVADAAAYTNDVLFSSNPGQACEPGSEGTVTVRGQTNGALELSVELEQPGWIFWSQTNYPGWRYTIDGGRAAAVLSANYIFQAAPVPAGTHTVVFYYRPASFVFGAVVSAVSLAAISVSAWIKGKKRMAGQPAARS